MASISCKNCDGQMEESVRAKHSQGMGFFFIVLGIICFAVCVGIPIGILLVGTGIYFCCAKENVWLCKSCKIVMSRVE